MENVEKIRRPSNQGKGCEREGWVWSAVFWGAVAWSEVRRGRVGGWVGGSLHRTQASLGDHQNITYKYNINIYIYIYICSSPPPWTRVFAMLCPYIPKDIRTNIRKDIPKGYT